jgi:hypothetical protein
MKNAFNWRIFTSIGLFLSFVMILLSGVILYIFPGERAIGFIREIAGLTKPAWQHQHIIFASAFSLLSLYHLFFINRKAFLSCLKTKTSRGKKLPAELLTIITLFVFTATGTFAGIQPFSGILEFGQVISRTLEQKTKRASLTYSEHKTLGELSEQPDLGGNPEALIIKLANAGIEVDSQNQTLAEIAATNSLTVATLSEIINAEGSRPLPKPEAYTNRNKEQQRSDDERRISTREENIALHQEKFEAGTDSNSNLIADNNNTEMRNAQAPDDALHRRTTASCASCH